MRVDQSASLIDNIVHWTAVDDFVVPYPQIPVSIASCGTLPERGTVVGEFTRIDELRERRNV